MKLLILGKNGQVGSELVEHCLNNKIKFIATDRSDLDLSDEAAVRAFLKSNQDVSFIINATAYTAVDKAELNKDIASAINFKAVAVIAEHCKEYNIPFFHISTDYVFDGSKPTMYSEEDATSPLGVYGDTKLKGECAIQNILSKYIILRVSWVFGKNGHNFVKTMAKLAGNKHELGVVSDQYGSPTAAKHIAEVIVKIIKHCLDAKPEWGIFHYSDFPITTWHQLAKASVLEAKNQGINVVTERINSIESKDYPTPVERPKNSALNVQKIYKSFGIEQQCWCSIIPEIIQKYKQEIS